MIEGGANDTANSAEKGTFDPNSFDPDDFDDEKTFAGGLERAIYTAVKEHGDTAAIGYMSIFKVKNETFADTGEFFALGEQICKKWGIAYLDLYTMLGDFDVDTYTHDGLHANEAGYNLMQPYIDDYIPTMRPISKDIYLKVQKYPPIPKVIGYKK